MKKKKRKKQIVTEKEKTVLDNIETMLKFIGEDPKREGLQDTPMRVLRSWEQLFSGYKQEPKDVLTMFEKDEYNGMVLLKDIEFYSCCEHHMLPFFGTAHVAYIPRDKVIGISKLARIVEIYSRRLQIQERLTDQITSALMDYLQPSGAACMIEAKHFCMLCRGVQKQNSVMVTSSLRGCFEQHAVKQEFLDLIKGR